ncbi:MAG TPA: Calx-beta domain-containing protein [Verrucomicrobiota bacterium]|nr:Calx-beta domain-containing protein [Verrucomicrobiota bacterium]HNU52013.1 Calx-beta domain-containing protein [Verrucomicrobiota bacterium]
MKLRLVFHPGIRRRRLVLVSALAAAFGLSANAQSVLFSDDFDTDTSAQWSVYDGSGSSPHLADYTIQFAFDYGAQLFTAHGVTGLIPPAPNCAGGTTRGLKVTVNKNDNTPAIAAVCAYAKARTFSGNHALRFDLWINYCGAGGGGNGSTEYAIFGINHAGTRVNWANTALTDSDGVWYAVTGEGGASIDYRAYEGLVHAAPNHLQGADAAFLDRNGDGLTEFEVNATQPETYPLQAMFPAPEYETPGMPGKRWVQVEIAQRDGHVLWKINGFVIAERPNTSGFDSGTIMLGTMDIFSSIASPREDNFVIFDNVRVVALDAEPPPVAVRVEASDPLAAEPADEGAFTFTRESADLSQPLEVPFRLSGTAHPGTDYQSDLLGQGKVTIPADETSVTVPVVPMDDLIGEPIETVLVTLTGNPACDMRLGIAAEVQIADDADIPAVELRVVDGYAYERLTEDPIVFELTRTGNSDTELTVHLESGGNAASGADFTPAIETAVLPAGEIAVRVALQPADDAEVEGPESLRLTIVPGDGYVVGPVAAAEGVILDDDFAACPILFSDTFDVDTLSGWEIRFGANNGIEDYVAQSGYDYGADGIVPAPHGDGSTLGLKLTVNKLEPTALGAAGVNLYPRYRSFSGDFAVRFDMFLSFDVNSAYSTEHATFGIHHSGAFTNRHASAGSDGVWFAVETDGSASDGGRSYTSYLGGATPGAVPSFIPKPASDFAAYYTAPPYLAAGAASGQWVDVEIRQEDGAVVLTLNGVEVFRRTDTARFSSGNLMLGYMDTFNSIGTDLNYVLYDNLRVVDLDTTPPPAPTIESLVLKGETVLLTFTAADGEATQFTVVGAPQASGPWSNEPLATIISYGDHRFAATIPGPLAIQRYYRIHCPDSRFASPWVRNPGQGLRH